MQSDNFGNNEKRQDQRRDFRLAIIGPTGSGKTVLAQQLVSEALTFGLSLRTLSLASDGYDDAIFYGNRVPSVQVGSVDLLQRWNSAERIVHGVSDRADVGNLSHFNTDVPVVLVIDGLRGENDSDLPSCGGGLLLQTFQHPESIPVEMQPDGYLIQVGSSGMWTFRYSANGKGRKTAQWLRLDELVNRVLCRQPLDFADTPYRNRVDKKMAAAILANCHHTVKFASQL